MFPGRSHEVPGDRHPREMIMAPYGEQNSAYNPLQNFSCTLAQAPRRLFRGTWASVRLSLRFFS